MSYSLIPSADYKAACDAIRAKTGKTDLIKSGDMASEIASVETEPVLQEKTFTENGSYVPDSGYDGFSTVKVDVPDTPPVLQEKTATINGEVVADEGYDGLSKVIVDVATDESVVDAIISGMITEIKSNASPVQSYKFYSCSKLTSADFPLARNIGASAFQYCTQLSTVNFPLVNYIFDFAFHGCSQLPMVDLSLASKINNRAFAACTALSTFILRSKTVCTLQDISAFLDTPIASGTGYIYVPSALIEEYKAATNWSTYAAQFRALEDYTVDGTTTGELDPEKI